METFITIITSINWIIIITTILTIIFTSNPINKIIENKHSIVINKQNEIISKKQKNDLELIDYFYTNYTFYDKDDSNNEFINPILNQTKIYNAMWLYNNDNTIKAHNNILLSKRKKTNIINDELIGDLMHSLRLCYYPNTKLTKNDYYTNKNVAIQIEN